MKRIIKILGVGFLFFSFASIAYSASDVSSLPVNLAVSSISNILYFVAFVGGALMILSPCSAATLPAYFASSFGAAEKPDKLLITKRTVSFFGGFALVYAFIGAGASFIGRMLNVYQEQLSIAAGILLIIFAVLMLTGIGFGRSRLHSRHIDGQGVSYKRIFVYGMLFAVGFSGCAGPVLAGILTIAVNLPSYQAILLMLFYSLGMGVPLVLLSLFFDKIKIFNTKFFTWNKKVEIAGKNIYLTLPNIISGILLAVIGIVFIVYRSTFVLSAKFPRALTEAGYAIQDKLLKMNLPGYVDLILFVVVGFVVIKLIEKYSDNIVGFFTNITAHLDKIKWVLAVWLVINFIFNQALFFSLQSDIKRQVAAAEEAARPADFELILITKSDCQECYNLNSIINSFKSRNVNIKSENTYDLSDPKAQELIEKYNISRIPTFIAVGEINKDQELRSMMERVGRITDNVFVFVDTPAPYIDIETGEIRGKFDLVYITDDSCSECYSYEVHRSILQRLGLNPSNINAYDISSKEGKDMISKYNIKSVPTIILRGDIGAYQGFDRVWQQVGTIEEDGVYVFRRTEVMGTYKDLNTGEIVEVDTGSAAVQNQNQNSPSTGQDVSGQTAPEGNNVIVLNAEEFQFSTNSIKVKKGETVTIRLVNKGRAPHDFVIDGLNIRSSRLSGGQTENIVFTPDKTGKFTFYCSVPGHREAGMEGIIEVVE